MRDTVTAPRWRAAEPRLAEALHETPHLLDEFVDDHHLLRPHLGERATKTMPPKDRSQMACHICGEVGHLKADCPQRGEGAPPPDTGTASCKICGMEKSRDEFSQNQWKKRKTSETGIACTLCADTMDRPPRRDGDEPRAKNPGRNVRCFNCGERGHISALCPLPRELGPRCYNCNEVGHISKDCPRERVAIN